MAEDRVVAAVEEAMNPETFDVLAYIDGQPVAREEIKIYVDVARSRRLHEVMDERAKTLDERKKKSQQGQATGLSLADDEEETEYDNEINELVKELERTGLLFKLKTVPPKLSKAIRSHYVATAPKDNAVAEEEHDRKANADIFSRAIDKVVRGDGVEDTTEWTAQRLMDLEDRLYPQQAARLISALYDMVNTGYVFEEALTADFS